VCTRTLEPIVEAETGAHAGGAWLRAGANRAAIDPSMFSGAPRLSVTTGSRWVAELTGARFPGLDLPAGMTLAVIGAGTRARLALSHELGGFAAEVPLAAWLAGERAATSTVSLGEIALDLGGGHALTLSGVAKATLAPDWSMRIEAPGVATLTGFGETLVASAVTIALAPQGASTLMGRRISRRSLVTLEAAHGEWTPAQPFTADGHLLEFAPGVLDRVTIEAAEARSGAVHRAAVVYSSNGGAAVYTPAARSGDVASPMPLRHVRYARMLDDSGSFHVAADFGPARWVRAVGQTLLLGGADWALPFEASGSGRDVRVHAEPAVSGVAVDIPGAIASPVLFPEEARHTVRLGDSGGSKGAGVPLPIGSARDRMIIPTPPRSYINITRPDDLLTLRLELFNLSIGYTNAGRLALFRTSPNLHAYLSVTFPGQHAVERAYRESQTPGDAPYEAYLADESRLAFEIPDSVADAGIDYSISGADGTGEGALLDWSRFTHVVVDAALASKTSDDLAEGMYKPHEGRPVGGDYPMIPPLTSLEIPWGLYMSPEPGAFWTHRFQPLVRNDRTELWHTKLHGAKYLTRFSTADGSAKKPESTRDDAIIVIPPITWHWHEKAPTLRAVWSRHYDIRLGTPSGSPDAPTDGLFRNSFTTSMADSPWIFTPGFPLPTVKANDIGGIKERWAITDLSGRYHYDPIKINRLMMTSLGAWMDSQASWPTDEIATTKSVATELIQWDHRMTMGRDQYVKVVKFGRLYPFGHKAAQVTITERKVKTSSPFAYLEQRTFIIVREPILDFAIDASPIDRGLPFKRVEIKSLTSPSVDAGAVSGVADTNDAFWPRVVGTGVDFYWVIRATDWDDVIHEFQMPLIYVRGFVAGKYDSEVTYSAAKTVLDACSEAIKTRTAYLHDKSVAYAKNVAGAGGDPSRVLPTHWMKFTAETYDPSAAGEARFFPQMHTAEIKLDAIEELTGQSAGTEIKIAQLYRDSGFGGSNAAGRVFAEMVTAPSLGFPASLSGALATPIPQYTGISASKGAVGGNLNTVGSGNFNPAEFFDVLNAKIIGGVTLISILEKVLGLDKMPVFEKIKDIAETDELVVRLLWETPVKSSNKPEEPESSAIFVAGSGAMLKLSATIRKKLKNAELPPSSTVEGSLGPFTLQLLPPLVDAIHIKFKLLSFVSVDGGSPTVVPEIEDVEFVGALKYLAELQKYMGALGQGGGSALAASYPSSGRDDLTVVDNGPLKIDVDGSGIKASLTFQLPDVTIGVFSLKNMSVFAGLTLPFDGSAVLLDFAFCSRESPFELLVMGFGGGGYVLVTLATDGLRAIEISLEFGAGTTFSIGSLASGSVEIKGGLTFRYEKKGTGDELTFVVFIRIRGSLEVLGLITVTVTFYLELRYREFDCPAPSTTRGNELTGTATLTIEIEILFFSTSVDLSVTKTLAGSDPRFGDCMPLSTDWDTYCDAFAPATVGA
jgi:hypothetical protein